MSWEMSLYAVPISDRWSVEELIWYDWKYDELSSEEQWEVRQFVRPNYWESLQKECITPLLGFWCKAYHIDGWFDEHVKYGIDWQGQFLVSIDQLLDIGQVCRRVMRNRQRASRYLWTPLLYDARYFRDIQATIGYVEQAVTFLRGNPDYCCVYSVG